MLLDSFTSFVLTSRPTLKDAKPLLVYPRTRLHLTQPVRCRIRKVTLIPVVVIGRRVKGPDLPNKPVTSRFMKLVKLVLISTCADWCCRGCESIPPAVRSIESTYRSADIELSAFHHLDKSVHAPLGVGGMVIQLHSALWLCPSRTPSRRAEKTRQVKHRGLDESFFFASMKIGHFNLMRGIPLAFDR